MFVAKMLTDDNKTFSFTTICKIMFKKGGIKLNNSIILVNSQFLGNGNDTLGEGLLETFFTLLKQNETLPEAIFFVNSGVYALTERSLASLHIKELSRKGVKILACKTCVDFYEIGGDLTAGEISSMKHFIELASKYNVITL